MSSAPASSDLHSLQQYLQQHHGGDGNLAAQRTLDNYSRHHNQDFWAFWQHQTAAFEQPLQMLDLGCGAGQFLRDVALQHPDWHCTGVECAPYMLEHMVELPANARVVIDDLNQPHQAFDHNVSLIMANMLVHELHQPVALFRTIKSWLADDGVLILIDMVRQPLQSYMEHSHPDLTMLPRPELEYAFSQYAEHNRYSADDLQWLLHQCGFEVLQRDEIRSGRAVRLVARPGKAG